jgi:hypothetical protein
MGMVSSRTLGLSVIASVGYSILILFAMHLLQPELSPLRVPMSAYVLGAYGTLITISYFTNCAGWLAVSYGLVTTLPRTRLTKVAFGVSLIASAGFLVAGIFPMDYPPPIRTSSGRLHALGGILTFPAMALASGLFSLSIRREITWRTVSIVALALSVGIIAAFVLMVFSIRVLGFGGYAQRLLMALLFGWMLLVGLHLARTPRVT